MFIYEPPFIKRTRPGRPQAWFFTHPSTASPRASVPLGVSNAVDGSNIYLSGDEPHYRLHPFARVAALRCSETNSIHSPADETLTMMHHVPPAGADAAAAALGRQPLNCALPSARQLTKVSSFLSIQ